MDPETRAAIRACGISVWLRADLDLLVSRVSRRNNRPLLAGGDPREILQRLMNERNPIYAEADVVVESGDGPHEQTVEAVLGGARRACRGAAARAGSRFVIGEHRGLTR